MVKVLHVEATPNPDALKFIVDQKILASGAKSFDDPSAGKNDSLAKALFSLKAVRSVFYMDRFVTVSKVPGVEWNGLQAQVIEAIQTTADSIQDETTATGQAAVSDDILSRIHLVLDQSVRPALAGDGGGLEILDYQDYVLTVHYQGACGSCPSASAGTLSAIQNLLQRMVDPKIQVVSS